MNDKKTLPAPAIAWLTAGVSLTVLGAGLYYLLRENGDVRSGLMLWLLPVITGCFAAAKLEQGQAETRETLTGQTQKLTQIGHQTNGVLDEKIRRCVKGVLDERDAERHRIASATQPADVEANVSLGGDEL